MHKNFNALPGVFAGMRIGEITEPEFRWVMEKNLTSSFLGFKIELRVHRAILQLVEGVLSSFHTTAAEDNDLLSNASLSPAMRTAIVNRKGVKELLEAVKVYTLKQWLAYLNDN